MPITKEALEASEILTPIGGIGTAEITVGLLGAKVDPFRFGFGDSKYITEVRLLEIERRILAIEAASGTEAQRAETTEIGSVHDGPTA